MLSENFYMTKKEANWKSVFLAYDLLEQETVDSEQFSFTVLPLLETLRPTGASLLPVLITL